MKSNWISEELEFKKLVKKVLTPIISKSVYTDKLYIDALMDGPDRCREMCESFGCIMMADICNLFCGGADECVDQILMFNYCIEALGWNSCAPVDNTEILKTKTFDPVIKMANSMKSLSGVSL